MRKWSFSVGQGRGATQANEVTVKTKKETKLNRYSQIIEKIFLEKYKDEMTELAFSREDIARVAKKIGI